MQIVLDIETLPIPRDAWLALTNRAPADTPHDLADQQDAYEKARFQGAFIRIVCIGTLVIPPHGSPHARVWYGDDEAALLSGFWSAVRQEQTRHARPIQYITHNGFGFDFPILWQRSCVHQIKPVAFPSLSRYSERDIFDTMEIWSRWDHRQRIALDILARILNVPTKSGHGCEVAQQWLSGAHHDVARYCLQDLAVTYSCYRKLSYQPVPPVDTLLADAELIHCPAQPPAPLL